MKRLVFNKWYWWISNDPNIWGAGSVFNAEWVEVRENSKKVRLSKWTYSNKYLSSNDTVVWYNYFDGAKYLRLHRSWKISNFFRNDVDNWNYVTDLAWSAYNIWDLTTPVWRYGFVISSWNLYQWVYNTNFSLWIYADSTSWLWTNMDFSSGTWWTIWTNWSISWWLATHTSWSTSVLSQTLSPTNWQAYRIEVRTFWAITWSCVVKMWWATIWSINTTNQTLVWFRTATSTSETLEFVPTSDFTWWIDSVLLQEYYMGSYSKNFNEKAPFIVINNFIYIGNGSKITEVDTTTSNWIITDVLKIDLDYTIKWITKIWDQVFIYASNWNSTRQYLRDWVSEAVNVSITWVDKNCVNVANWANQDYIVTSSSWTNRTWLWLVNWYQLQDIFTNTENTNPSNERIFFQSNYTNAIETIGKRLLIPWNEWVYTYWWFTPWLPTSLVKEYIYLWWEISAMSYNESNSNRIVYSYTWTINWITWIYEDLVQITGWYNSRTDMSGFIELPPHTWECMSNIKDLEKLTIWAKIISWTQINVYSKNEDRTIKYANIPYQYTTIPTIWATYTFDWNTYTVYAVTNLGSYCILHCTYTWTGTWVWWTFTKTNWTWDTTFYCERVRYGYKLLWQLTDTTTRRHQIKALDCAEKYYELQIWVELLTSSTSKTPEFSDINLYFNETNDD